MQPTLTAREHHDAPPSGTTHSGEVDDQLDEAGLVADRVTAHHRVATAGAIGDGRCAVGDGPHSDPTLVVMASAENWMKVVDGKLDPQFAFMTGRLRVRGDMGLALRLRALFL